MSHILYIVKGSQPFLKAWQEAGIIDIQLDLKGENGNPENIDNLRKMQAAFHRGFSIAAILDVEPDEKMIDRLKFLAQLEGMSIIAVIPI